MPDKLAEAGTGLVAPGAAVADVPVDALAEKQALRAKVEQLETELLVQKREQAVALNELAQANARTAAADQVAKEQEELMTHLLAENKTLVKEQEHLRTILNAKDQMIAEVREAPQTLMTELVQLRHQYEEATSHRKWMEAERDAAQLEMSRRALVLGHAEEELRRLRHQNEKLERLSATTTDAGAELSKSVQENSALSIELAQIREKLAAIKQQLGAGHKGISLLVSELGAKVYALRAAIARLEGSFEQAAGARIHDMLDQLLANLNDGNSHVHALRELAEQSGSEAATPGAQLPS